MMTHSSLEEKSLSLQKKFQAASTAEEKYRLLIDLGKEISSQDLRLQTETNAVAGCQSKLYLHAEKREGKIFFKVATDALISAGLAAILIAVYDGEKAETILTHPPQFLHTLGIHASLSPNRSHGILHIHLKMKQLALKLASV